MKKNPPAAYPSGKKQPPPPDGRGPRPTDPNELARWIVEQAGDEIPPPRSR